MSSSRKNSLLQFISRRMVQTNHRSKRREELLRAKNSDQLPNIVDPVDEAEVVNLCPNFLTKKIESELKADKRFHTKFSKLPRSIQPAVNLDLHRIIDESYKQDSQNDLTDEDVFIVNTRIEEFVAPYVINVFDKAMSRLDKWLAINSYPCHFKLNVYHQLCQILNKSPDTNDLDFERELEFWANHADKHGKLLSFNRCGVRKASKELSAYFSQEGYLEGALDSLPYGINAPKKLWLLTQEKWHARQLRKRISLVSEEIALRLGHVGGIRKYCTNYNVQRRRIQFERNYRWLRSQKLHDWVKESKGEDYSLAEIAKNSQRRRARSLAICEGLKAQMERNNLVGLMITVTAPAVYHVNPSSRSEYTPGWRVRLPSETNNWLLNKESKVDAMMYRRGLVNPPTLRVADPHADATPHHHLVTLLPEDSLKVLYECYGYHFNVYTQITWNPRLPSDPLYKEEQTVKVKLPYRIHRDADGNIDEEYSDVTILHAEELPGNDISRLYLYALKNVDKVQNSILEDHYSPGTTGTDKKLNQVPSKVNEYLEVDAWAATHGIKRIGWKGIPSLTVWDKVRNVDISNFREDNEGEVVNKNSKKWQGYRLLSEMVKAAKSNNFDEYINLNGGLFIKRRSRKCHPVYSSDNQDYLHSKKSVTGILIRLQTKTFLWNLAAPTLGAHPYNSLVEVSPKYPRGSKTEIFCDDDRRKWRLWKQVLRESISAVFKLLSKYI